MIIVSNNQTFDVTITDLDIKVLPDSFIELSKVKTIHEIAASSSLTELIVTGDLSISVGGGDFSVVEGVTYLKRVRELYTPKDRSGKIRIHQTSRKLGLRIMWIGLGDDTSDVTKVGFGEPMTLHHAVGNVDPLIRYIDFNTCENETWMHEGYITWTGARLDKITVEMVSRYPEWQPGTNTTFANYNGLIVPAAGNGDVELTGDFLHPNGGMVYCPDNDLGEKPFAFWDADYNPDTQRYENFRPNVTATGRFNMFMGEYVFARFMNQMPLLESGFIALNSSDTDQLGQGMRLKITADTNFEIAEDHEWSVACTMCMHRDRSV